MHRAVTGGFPCASRGGSPGNEDIGNHATRHSGGERNLAQPTQGSDEGGAAASVASDEGGAAVSVAR